VTPPTASSSLPAPLALAFAPLHKRALGLATGLALGLFLFLATAISLLREGGQEANLWLLGQYLTGYTQTWPGAVIGFAWGMGVGFVAGWFIAFCRNFVIAASLFWIRARNEIDQTRDFLDHI
jgi:hypothetical protein